MAVVSLLTVGPVKAVRAVIKLKAGMTALFVITSSTILTHLKVIAS